MVDSKELIEHYNTYFVTVNASSDHYKNLAYHLRHEVYFEEYGYATKEGLKKQIEFDEYDEYSFHSLLLHRKTKSPIGYIRLIPFNHLNIPELPIEHHCKNNVFMDIFPHRMFKNKNTGEISRMSILAQFRRRECDQTMSLRTIQSSHIGNRRFPINYLPLCLILSSMHFSLELNLKYVTALMERRLAILLRRYGVKLQQIGDEIELYGKRAPFMIETHGSYNNLKPEYQSLYHVISHELKDQQNNVLVPDT